MYCQYCGKELLDSNDEYCRHCGKKLKKDSKLNTSTQNKTPTLKWFNFFYKIYLPIIIFLNFIFLIPQVSQIVDYGYFNFLNISYIILCLALYIFIPLLAYLKIKTSKETGYKFILLFLLGDYVCKIAFTSVNTTINYNGNIFVYIIVSTLIYAIWFVPNLIYFFKRKDYFCNKNIN